MYPFVVLDFESQTNIAVVALRSALSTRMLFSSVACLNWPYNNDLRNLFVVHSFTPYTPALRTMQCGRIISARLRNG